MHISITHIHIAISKESLELTAEHKSVGLTLDDHEFSATHPSLTDIDSTISLLGSNQPHTVNIQMLKVGEGSNTWGDLLCSLEKDNFWSWETKIDTLNVY